MAPLTISVIICTHNPRAEYIGRCIAGLRAQTLPADVWQLILVDNRSAEPLAGRVDIAWHPHALFLREERLGLTAARLAGIHVATGEVLVFVDDDNVLDADYLEQVLRIAADRPYLGAWSGQCRPEFEQPPPEWTRRYWGNLVIREFDADVWSNVPRLPDTMPCGAGLCLRSEVAKRYVALQEAGTRLELDRAGSALLSGGDNDMAACACDLGLGVGLIAALKLTHLIPPQRLTADYLARLAEGISFSSAILDAERGAPLRPRDLVGRLADILRLMRLPPPHREILRASMRGRAAAVRMLR